MDTPPRYARNLRGHGATPRDPRWPGGARIAVQFVLNYEEGGENCVLHGDAASEAFLSDIPGAAPWPGQRHWNMESVYDYGARAGFWRLHRLFTGAGIPLTIYGVATALARSPEQVAAMQAAGWEIASHGLKWVEHKDMPEAEERAAIAEAIRLHAEVTGTRPHGWYTGRCSENTVRLIAEEGGFDYVSDAYDDDLPYWLEVGARDQAYLCDAFDTLYAEGQAGAPRMMTVGLHCRLVGRPGKIAGLGRFIAHIQSHEGVWCPRRIDIARHWAATHPPRRTERPSAMDRDRFVAAFGDIFEHSPWIAERAHALDLQRAAPPGLIVARAISEREEPEERPEESACEARILDVRGSQCHEITAVGGAKPGNLPAQQVDPRSVDRWEHEQSVPALERRLHRDRFLPNRREQQRRNSLIEEEDEHEKADDPSDFPDR